MKKLVVAVALIVASAAPVMAEGFRARRRLSRPRSGRRLRQSLQQQHPLKFANKGGRHDHQPLPASLLGTCSPAGAHTSSVS